MTRLAALVLLVLATSACDRTAAASSGQTAADGSPREQTEPAALDTASAPISPAIEAALDSFRAGPEHAPDGLTGNAMRSRDALVAAFVHALEAADTAVFAPMMISRAEFGWIYYPHTMYVRPPYEMAPDVLWMLLVQNAEKGIARALAEYGGRSLGYSGYRCRAEPKREGANRIWEECVVDLKPDTTTETIRLFGSIIEHGGRFKFMSYSNGL